MRQRPFGSSLYQCQGTGVVIAHELLSKIRLKVKSVSGNRNDSMLAPGLFGSKQMRSVNSLPTEKLAGKVVGNRR